MDKFNQALKQLPSCCLGNFDPMNHKTIGDLVFCAQHELDLYQEGEDSDIKSKKDAAVIRKFLNRWILIARAEGVQS